MRSEELLRLLIRESVFRLYDGTETEYGSSSHVEDLDRIISELQHLKKTLKRGSKRLQNRKEIHRIQSSIEAIRYLRNGVKRLGIRSGLIAEGGLKIPGGSDKKLNPTLVGQAIKVYENLLGQWNSYLELTGHDPVKPIKPVGSVSYYSQDALENPDAEYGDIDYLVELPVMHQESSDEKSKRQIENAIKREYEQLFVNFLNAVKPAEVDIELTLKPSATDSKVPSSPYMVIITLPGGESVQVDTVTTYPRSAEWMGGRYTPERGVKGYLIGNIYKSLGDHLVMSIGTQGVAIKSREGKRVPAKFQKGVQVENISTDIGNFLVDIAAYLVGDNLDPHPLLVGNPGVDKDNVSMRSLVKGIKGLALTLEAGGDDDALGMMNAIKAYYEENLRRNVEQKKTRGLNEKDYQKLLKMNDAAVRMMSEEFGL